MGDSRGSTVHVPTKVKGRGFEFRSNPEINWVVEEKVLAHNMVADKPRQSEKNDRKGNDKNQIYFY